MNLPDRRLPGLPLESAVLWCLSLLFLLASASGLALELGESRQGYSGFAIDEGFLFEYALILLVLGLGAWALRLAGTSIAAQLRMLPSACAGLATSARDEARWQWDRRWTAMVLVLCTVVSVVLIRRPLSYDEAFTSIYFLHSGPSGLLYYPLPNNHVLMTLLMAPLVAIFGDGPVTLRLPAVSCFMAAAVLMLRVGRCVSPRSGGYLASVGLVGTPLVAAYGSQARGYSLLVLLAVAGMLVLADERRFPWHVKPVALSAIGALSMLVMPSAAYLVAALAAWGWALAWRQVPMRTRAGRDFLLIHLVMGVVLSALAWLPVLMVNRATAIVDNRFVRPLPFDAFVAQVPGHVRSSWEFLVQGVPDLMLLAVMGLAAWGVWRAFHDRDTPLVASLPAALLGVAAVFVIKHAIPYPRTWVVLVPLVLLAADAGFAQVLDQARRDARRIALALVFVIAAAGQARYLASGRGPADASGGAAPDARAMAATLNLRVKPTDWLCANVPEDALLRYYLTLDAPLPKTAFGGSGDIYYVVPGGARPPLRTDLVAASGDLRLLKLSRTEPIDAAGKGFHCWLRGGYFFG